jgi:general secretion pathway protein G
VQPSITFWLILGILLILIYELVVPKIGGLEHSPIAVVGADIHGGIKTALDQYKIDNGFYPKSFNDLVQKPIGATNWFGPYLDQLPIDPWGDKYIYEFPGKHNTNGYDLMSVGRDGKRGTEDDIGNW